jgi:hypothetical protein
MIKFILPLILILSGVCFADQKAVTENGDEVVLHDNGTWEKSSKKDEEKKTIPVNPGKFEKGAKASFNLKSKVNGSSIAFDSGKWSFTKSGEGESAEYEFKMKDSDLMATMITERIEVQLDRMAEVALNNAKDAAPDAKLLSCEYRTVNGKKVLMAQITGTISGISFIYYSYYYSDDSGTTQLVTFTSQKLFPKYKQDAEDFLNGFLAK